VKINYTWPFSMAMLNCQRVNFEKTPRGFLKWRTPTTNMGHQVVVSTCETFSPAGERLDPSHLLGIDRPTCSILGK
jgi:hypothetical protein